MTELYTISLSVRQLAEHVYRSGSIDVRSNALNALQEGTIAHQRVQGSYKAQDEKERYLKTTVEIEDELLFIIDGRCDGLLATEPATIDEIKSTNGNLELIEENTYPVHWAQAICYAYMFAKEQDAASMLVQLTYVQKESKQERRFVREMSYEELKAFFLDLIQSYMPFAKQQRSHNEKRNSSAAALTFPFDSYRAGQRKLAGAVYRTIEEGVRLLARAPTGTGKTISTLFPAIKAISSGLLERIFYLTARTTTRVAAESALLQLKAGGLYLHAVTLTAKEKICFQDEVRCEKEHCPFANGYYDRINGAVLDILTNETIMTRPIIEQYAYKHQVCPFEYSLDIAYAADAVICDYNYIFDPRISLKRQYAEMKKKTALLIDEAHNLVDRAREMYSAELTKAPFLALQRELKGVHAEGYAAAKAVNQFFIALRKESENSITISSQLPSELVELAEAFVHAAEAALSSGIGSNRNEAEQGGSQLLDAYFAAQQFVRTAKLFDERYVAYSELGRNEVTLKLFCMDPSAMLRQMGKGYRSHIYFSATLSPLSYYMDMLGAEEKDYTLSLPSPFSKEQLEVEIVPLSTRYHDREASYEPIARLLKRTLAARLGNFLAFFPSYAYMNTVHEAYMELTNSEHSDEVIMLQTASMSEEEREHFLASFQAGNTRPLIGFAVMGGIFSEGIDLIGNRLSGVAVIGVGLPQLGTERNLLRDYFNRQGKNGYDYSYVIPGMNKVQQAGGRLIRSETDRGMLLLIDDRYLLPSYQQLLPEEWRR